MFLATALTCLSDVALKITKKSQNVLTFRISKTTTSDAFLDFAIAAMRSAKVSTYFFPKILYIPVPQSGHLPLTAKRPFFIVTFCSSFISLDFLHLTQYPFSAICFLLFGYSS